MLRVRIADEIAFQHPVAPGGPIAACAVPAVFCARSCVMHQVMSAFWRDCRDGHAGCFAPFVILLAAAACAEESF